MPKHVWANGRGSCTIRTATAIARQSVCWRLKKHPNLIIKLFISMAASWLSLAHEDEAIGNLFASWDTDEAIRTDGIVVA